MDDTITLTFWVGGGVFVAVCLFMVYCVFRYSYKEGRKAEYKPEDKKLEKILKDVFYPTVLIMLWLKAEKKIFIAFTIKLNQNISHFQKF